MDARGGSESAPTVGNVRGRARAQSRRPGALLGSHLDSVRDAGRYDGPLGILVAIEAVDHLRQTTARPSRLKSSPSPTKKDSASRPRIWEAARWPGPSIRHSSTWSMRTG